MLSVLVNSQLTHALVWPNERPFLAERSFHKMINHWFCRITLWHLPARQAYYCGQLKIIMINRDLQDYASGGSRSRQN